MIAFSGCSVVLVSAAVSLVTRYKPTRLAGFLRASIVGASCAAVAVIGGGCTSQTVETYPTLTGHFAAEASMEPLIAEQGRLDSSSYEIVFRQGADRYVGGGNLEPLFAAAGSQADVGGPLLVPLEYWQSSEDAPPAGDAVPAKVLGVAAWHTVRDRLFASLIPSGTGEGIVCLLYTSDAADDLVSV